MQTRVIWSGETLNYTCSSLMTITWTWWSSSWLINSTRIGPRPNDGELWKMANLDTPTCESPRNGCSDWKFADPVCGNCCHRGVERISLCLHRFSSLVLCSCFLLVQNDFNQPWLSTEQNMMDSKMAKTLFRRIIKGRSDRSDLYPGENVANHVEHDDKSKCQRH